MFVQVIQGGVSDAAALKAALERWKTELAPGAAGWLGSTGGVTDDGKFIALVRFESVDAARRNSERPEQAAWWNDVSSLFSDVVFHDCAEVETHRAGGSDSAGFVQVIQGRVTDMPRMRALSREMDEKFGDFRPDVIGGITALHGDGGFTDSVYFVSEAEARAGESQEVPAELREVWDASTALMEDVSYFDLRDPWMMSP
ncbi:hypothetical protein ACPA54_25885 [Uniformispora flossi]|uniref:hypothetical protein n=1 Tax=Uniformispora flossi TaxID=3390723 RepID=UPI003C2B7B59